MSATLICDAPALKVRPAVSRVGSATKESDTPATTSPTRLKPVKKLVSKPTDRRFPKAEMSVKEVLALLVRLRSIVQSYAGKPREVDHALCIVAGCVHLLDQCQGDWAAWFRRYQTGARKTRIRVMNGVEKRPHGKDQKRFLTDLLTLTETAVGASSNYLKKPSTGSLPLSWNL